MENTNWNNNNLEIFGFNSSIRTYLLKGLLDADADAGKGANSGSLTVVHLLRPGR
jgi:hypothetical protein